jgi:NAD(P)-dependent dehydrogenase (short-subunit alcohol dehydrogenase family)
MAANLFALAGRVAVVSGAARGMGRAMAIGFAEYGADLLLADIDAEGMEDTAAEIEALGRKAVPAVCDVSDTEQIDALYGTLDREFGRIDVLSNVAGEGGHGDPAELTPEQIHESLQNLVVGRFHCTQQAGRRMIASGKGSIMSIVSIAGFTALGRHHIPYSMAMGAVAQMTRELSSEWAPLGVRVNAIVCAQVENQGLRDRMEADPVLRSNFLRGLPIGRLGRPEEVKGLAILLASDASSFMTGALIPLDGGNLAKNAGGSHPGMPPLGPS